MKIIIFLFIFLLSHTCIISASEWDWEYDLWVKELSSQNDVCPKLVMAVIEVESSFINSAVSPAGAVGFMQLMPSTARMLGIENPTDPVENLRGGIKYLGMLKKEFNRSIPLTLAAYNAGPAAVRRHESIPPFRETRNFVFRVLERYEYYKRRGAATEIFELNPE